MDIYRNTTGPIVDEMQLETLMLKMDDAFGVDLSKLLNDETTLADLANFVLNQSPSQEIRRDITSIWP